MLSYLNFERGDGLYFPQIPQFDEAVMTTGEKFVGVEGQR